MVTFSKLEKFALRNWKPNRILPIMTNPTRVAMSSPRLQHPNCDLGHRPHLFSLSLLASRTARIEISVSGDSRRRPPPKGTASRKPFACLKRGCPLFPPLSLIGHAHITHSHARTPRTRQCFSEARLPRHF